ncbi:MAG: serine/threonine protein kinase [Thermoguttaceae bacterium]|nr:serine/threonine protein kinase [Thermoguttaceae bacterium]
MPEFDPYSEWLDIPLNQRPINYYKFLGLIPPVSDPAEIDAACKRRRQQLQKEILGEHGAEAQTLLNELKIISDTLLNPVRKEAYDQKLFKKGVLSDVKLEPGYKIGPYELLKLRDNSAAGAMWQAVNTLSGKKCLIKVLPQRLAQRSQIAKRFLREIQLSSQLHHDNIVCASDSDGQGDPLYYVIPCEALTSLETYVRQNGLLTVDKALDFVCQAAQGLEYLHWKGIYHRNVRPDVLFLDENNVVKVGGLLTAKAENNLLLEGDFDEQLTQDGQMLGAADYMAPEQATNASAVDARCDVYSLGCTMFWLLTGRPVFNVKNSNLAEKIMAHRKAPIPRLSQFRSGIPQALDAVFQKMLAKNPDDRYKSMKEVIDAIQGARKGSSGSVKIPGWLWAIIGIAIGAAITAAVLLFR